MLKKIYYYFRLKKVKADFKISIKKWFQENGDQTLRLDYPLSDNSIVFDLGGYHGDFAYDINNKYNCYVYIFEPVKEYYLHCLSRFKGNNKIKCFNYGLSNIDGKFLISREANASSIVMNNHSDDLETVEIKCFSDDFKMHDLKNIDLLKINIEGPEFLILPHIISSGIIKKISNLQVQFHYFYPDAINLRNKIRNELNITHYEKYNFPFVWESWTIKN
jgi:FkbM family methyltransferase